MMSEEEAQAEHDYELVEALEEIEAKIRAETRAEIAKQIALFMEEIEQDERYKSSLKSPALVAVNAPLALIQQWMSGRMTAYRKVLELITPLGQKCDYCGKLHGDTDGICPEYEQMRADMEREQGNEG